MSPSRPTGPSRSDDGVDVLSEVRMPQPSAVPHLRAVGDLHVGHSVNREVAEGLHPGNPGDWLIVCGDVSENVEAITRTLARLRDRFAEVIWVPGNHELWTRTRDEVQLRGVARYEHLVDVCRSLGVHTPEDPFPVWTGAGGPVRVAPLFILYGSYPRAVPSCGHSTGPPL